VFTGHERRLVLGWSDECSSIRFAPRRGCEGGDLIVFGRSAEEGEDGIIWDVARWMNSLEQLQNDFELLEHHFPLHAPH
ncbi:hypothetical protein PFISCL1PPCAC_1393, partial [Pristionchus fissidentatus]